MIRVHEVKRGCPIGLSEVHCSGCMFVRKGCCSYGEIMTHAEVREEIYGKCEESDDESK